MSGNLGKRIKRASISIDVCGTAVAVPVVPSSE